MRNIKLGKTLLASALGLAVLTGFTPSAGASATTATFTVTSGLLSITAPASKALSSVAAGGISTAQLGDVVVSDQRGALAGSWTARVISTSFTTPGEGAPVIPATAVEYWSGAATVSSGTAVRVPGQLLAANKAAIDALTTAFSASGVVGNGSTTWNPTVLVNVPTGAVAGLYTGTITHSMA